MTRLPLALLLLLPALLPATAGAQSDRYTTLTAQLPLSARVLALGGAAVAVRDAHAALSNPAFAGAAPSFELTIGEYRSGATAALLSSSAVYGPVGLSLSIHHLDYSADQPHEPALLSRGQWLSSSGTQAVGATTIATAASMTWKGMRWGLGAAMHELRAADERSAILVASAGVSRDNFLLPGTLGLALQHMGPDLRMARGEAPPPSRLTLGFLSRTLPIGSYLDLSGLFGASVRRDGWVSGSAGLDLTWVPIEGVALSARSGARRRELHEQGIVTGGAGLSFDRVALDYAWEQMRVGGAHRFTFRVR